MNRVPGLLLLALLALIVSQACFIFLPWRPQRYPLVLALSVVGFGLGELWSAAGGMAWRVGTVHPLPDILVAVGLQPLGWFVRRPPGDARRGR